MRLYRFVKIGRRTILQVFSASEGYAPACIAWERIQAAQVPAYTRAMAERGILPFAAQASR